MLKRKFIKSIIFIGSALSSGMATSGEAKKLKIIVPFSAGGVVDRLVRMIAERLSQSGKYHAYVVNKPGAGGVIASIELTKQSGKEISCMIGTTVQALQPYRKNIRPETGLIYSKLQYQAILGRQDSYMVASNSRGIESFANLCDAIKIPKFGSQGVGSVGHLVGAELMRKVNKDSIHIPFNSSPEIINSILSGDIDFGFLAYDNFKGVLQAKKVKVLLSIGTEKSKLRPDVPLAKSLGLSELSRGSWFSLITSRSLDKELAANLVADIDLELRRGTFPEVMASMGIDLDLKYGEEAVNFMSGEVKYWIKLLNKYGDD